MLFASESRGRANGGAVAVESLATSLDVYARGEMGDANKCRGGHILSVDVHDGSEGNQDGPS